MRLSLSIFLSNVSYMDIDASMLAKTCFRSSQHAQSHPAQDSHSALPPASSPGIAGISQPLLVSVYQYHLILSSISLGIGADSIAWADTQEYRQIPESAHSFSFTFSASLLCSYVLGRETLKACVFLPCDVPQSYEGLDGRLISTVCQAHNTTSKRPKCCL